MCALLVVAAGLALAPPAQAATVNGAAFTGPASHTHTNGGILYARQGAGLTLAVATSSSRCVLVKDGTDTEIARATSNKAETSWSFSGQPWLTAASGDGLRAYTVLAYQDADCMAKTNQGQGGGETVVSLQASYVLDNTAPTATATLSPAPNSVGWNRNDVTVSWNATDAGSGVASVTPPTHLVTAEGVSQRTTTVTDRLGNTAVSSPVTVRLDRTAPAITGQATPAPNAAGWNNTPVTVTFAASDALSGVRSTSAPVTLTTDGAGRSVTGTATDNADNIASTTVSGINIDTTTPTLSGAPTTAPNENGWYRDNVTVAWTSTDSLSGVATTPADSTITGEGAGLTAAASVTDRAGNGSGSVTSHPAVQIDRTAPTTTLSAPPAWNSSDVTLVLEGNDGLSGVATTQWSLDGAEPVAGTQVRVDTEGTHTLEYWSTDRAGNTEARRRVTFGIDRTPPTIGHSVAPAPNADGWHNGDVTVTFTCADTLSGVAACTDPHTETREGRGLLVTGTVTDRAGNSVDDPVRLDVDRTPPQISVDPLPDPNALGWYALPVTVTFSASDGLSGVRSADRSHTFGEGAGQTVTARATDVADNRAEATTAPVDVDTTPPSITGRVVEEANEHGWFRDDVTVRWSCSDALSGVLSCPTDSVVTGEGAALAAAASATDRAGHVTPASVPGIRVDRTAPVTEVTGAPPGWSDGPVTLTLAAGDALSGVRTTYHLVEGGTTPVEGATVLVASEGVTTVAFWSVDRAGNVERPQEVTVRLDLTAPTVVATHHPEPNARGWHNTDVTVSFSCTDQPELSGLESCTEPVAVTAEGRGQQVSGSGRDAAGNRTEATTTVNLDRTPPAITGTPDRVANESGWYDAPVTVAFEASDGLSGVQSVTPPQRVGEGADQAVDGQATDNADNVAHARVAGLSVDLTPPDLSAAPTAAPNEHGWYRSPVTQVWTAFDDLSGLDGDVPAPQEITGEGRGQSVSATVRDLAGHATTATSAPVDIDLTPPHTMASAPDGWVNREVEVVLTPYDALSGVDTTWYRVDGGPRRDGTSLALTEDGTHTIRYGSTDRAGNEEETRTVVVRVDRVAPTIRHTLDPAANRFGWHRDDVTVTFTCADQDELSGVASCTPPQTVHEEGADQQVTGTVTDHAGNSATDVAGVNLDRTPPTIAARRSPGANAHGWTNGPVTVHFDAEDALSGLDTVTRDVTLGEGADQSVTGTAADAAGNEATATLDGIHVDLTPPLLSGEVVAGPNEHGWYRDDVTVVWGASDALSGVADHPAPSTVTGEGTGLRATTTVADRAGNTTTGHSPAVDIDRTPPSTTAVAPEGWSGAAVTLALEAVDGLSGVAATHHQVDGGEVVTGATVTVADEGAHVVRYWSVDRAGNVEEAHEVTVRVDLTGPEVEHTLTPAPNSHGWHRGPVTVGFTCADALSGVASCPEDVTVAGDGRGQVVAVAARDNAGNTSARRVEVNVDQVAPTITGTADRAPNGRGWYGAPVTVGFACSDALSGIDECASPVRLGEGADQAARGRARDTAGNTATATVEPINVDTTPPTLAGAPVAPAGPGGWYRDDVRIAWFAADGLSGLAGGMPEDGLVVGEGRGLSVMATVVDRAGHETTAASAPVDVDRTAPGTVVSDVGEWNAGDVTVELTATDNLSGVAATYSQVDDGPVTRGRSLTIAGEGVHTLRVWSEDVAGNVEPPQTVQVRIDATAPTIDHDLSPRPNVHGWSNADVTVTFRCGDDRSGVASCTAPVTLGEGGRQRVVGTAVDLAGNTAVDEVTVNVDKTPPTLEAVLSARPNVHGWYADPVLVGFECRDQAGLSGVVRCEDAVTVGEGARQAVEGDSDDAADNRSARLRVNGLDVDLTRPELTGTVATEPNRAGWFNGDVRVTWRASDALSGIDGDAPAAVVVTGEGDDLAASATVRDRAGHERSATVRGIRIDRTAPTTTAAAPTGWQAAPVTVRLTARDALSGVDTTYWTVDGGDPGRGTEVTVGAEGRHTVRFWSVDLAGNVEPAGSVTVLVDRSAPVITGSPRTQPNAAGWYADPVTVDFACHDAVSGIASCSPAGSAAVEGENEVSGTAVDLAGNVATTTVRGLRIDTVDPQVSIGGVQDGATYVVGGVPAATVAATDATSGLAGPATLQVTGGNASGVGTFTVTGTATDRAGNTGRATVTYQVVYGFGPTLFLQPINDTARQGGSTSVFNAGSTVPVKLQLRDAAGAVVRPLTAPQWLTPVKGTPTAAGVNEAAYAETATVGGIYVWDGTQYHYNWKTAKSQAGSYWRIGVALDDGRTYYVSVGLR